MLKRILDIIVITIVIYALALIGLYIWIEYFDPPIVEIRLPDGRTCTVYKDRRECRFEI